MGAGCRRSASTPASPAPTSTARWPSGGCTFCDNRSFSPSRRLPRRDIRGQIDEGIRRLKWRYDVDHFLAYFQPATNTYAPVERLRPLYEEALAHPQVVGLAIGTRPDCVPDDVLDLLTEMAGRTYLSVEYGMQTIHDRSLDWMNRGHHYDAFLDAVDRSRGRGFEICAHVMLGLPGESHDDMLATAREVARLRDRRGQDSQPVRRQEHAAGRAGGRGRGDADGARRVRADARRLSRTAAAGVPGRAHQRRRPARLLRRPGLVPRQAGIRAALDAEFHRRDTWQGRKYTAAQPALVD